MNKEIFRQVSKNKECQILYDGEFYNAVMIIDHMAAGIISYKTIKEAREACINFLKKVK